jgi:hypothetical protein
MAFDGSDSTIFLDKKSLLLEIKQGEANEQTYFLTTCSALNRHTLYLAYAPHRVQPSRGLRLHLQRLVRSKGCFANPLSRHESLLS